MATPETKPVIFLTFANPTGDGSLVLRVLRAEAEKLRELLEPLENAGRFTLRFRENVTVAQVRGIFLDYRNRIAIYHFGGHSDSLRLLLETSDGKPAPVYAETLAEFLGQQSGLKLVFLNACSNQTHVQGLLDAGVDAVIATSKDIDDRVATEFASFFYDSLAKGSTLQNAFATAAASIKLEYGNEPRNIRYAPPDDATVKNEEWPWSLTYRDGTQDAEHWKLPVPTLKSGSDDIPAIIGERVDKVGSDSPRLLIPRLDDITGKQHGELADALVAAFGDKETLRQMVAVELDRNLDAIAGGSTLSDIAFDLVGWAKRSGYLRELVLGAVDTLPRNAKLRAFALSVGAQEKVRTEVQKPVHTEMTPRPTLQTQVAGHHLFLAYSRKDSDIMQRLRNDLLEAGIVAWIDQEDLEPGSLVWQRAVEAAIRTAHSVVVILSPDAKESDWVNIEISLARRIGRRIFPVLGRGDEGNAVPFALETTHRIDVRTDFADGVHTKLIPTLRRHLGLDQPGAQKSEDVSKAEATAQIAVAKSVTVRPPIDIEWVTIPAGEFLLGSDKTKDMLARDDEMPQHRLHLPAFQIAGHPITNAQYQVFVKATGREVPKHWANGKIPTDNQNHPVIYVSWEDARAFCAWFSKVAGKTIRLPSEAEWEKAARGTDGRIWPWGNEAPTKDRCNFNRNVGNTTPVGAYPQGASPYEVLDMAGNVWEWTGSQYKSYPFQPDDVRVAPEGRATRTMRGGSWDNYVALLRCAVRNWNPPRYRSNLIGFRILSSGL